MNISNEHNKFFKEINKTLIEEFDASLLRKINELLSDEYSYLWNMDLP